MFFMFRIFPENFFDKKYQCIFRMFCERSNIGIFFPVNNCSLCLLFFFYCFFPFSFLCYRWFHQGTNPYTGTPDWLYSGGYFDRNFSDCPDIY